MVLGKSDTSAYSKAIPIIAEASQQATQETPKSIRIDILEVADTAIQLTRARQARLVPVHLAMFVVRLELGTGERCAPIVP